MLLYPVASKLQVSLLCTPGYGAVFTPSEEMDIRSFINASMECRGLPGMTTMVVKGNYIFYKHTAHL